MMPYTYPSDSVKPDAKILELEYWHAQQLAEALSEIGIEAWTETTLGRGKWDVVVAGKDKQDAEALVFGGWNWRT